MTFFNSFFAGGRAGLCALSLLVMPMAATAQDGSNLNEIQRDVEEINNGTNPTLLTTQMGIQYQYNRINPSLDTGLMELFYVRPFGDGSKALRFTLPFSDSPFNAAPNYGGASAADSITGLGGDEFRLGDISVTYIDVFHLTPKNGAAFTAELFLNTATTDTSGYGQFALETTFFYAWFLENGSIFAPAWVQTFGLEGGNDDGVGLNTTTIDFYYVPKLSNPKYYMTFDPALIHDWENDNTFGSLQVTMGMMTGKLWGGDSQVFIKPGILIGGDKPADWSLQVGFKVLNF